MKKILTTLLCSLPLVASATIIGGFEFKDEDILQQTEAGPILRIYKNSLPWVGVFEKNKFKFMTITGYKNKIWVSLTPSKGEIIANTPEGAAKSTLYLVELDCPKKKSRLLMARGYSDYFTFGNKIGEDIVDVQDWVYEGEPSFHITFGCAILGNPK